MVRAETVDLGCSIRDEKGARCRINGIGKRMVGERRDGDQSDTQVLRVADKGKSFRREWNLFLAMSTASSKAARPIVIFFYFSLIQRRSASDAAPIK